jgi:hypothetical protein
MKADEIPCLFEDKQEQLNAAIEYVCANYRYTINVRCRCGCGIVMYLFHFDDADFLGSKLELHASGYVRPLARWYFTQQDKQSDPPLQHIISLRNLRNHRLDKDLCINGVEVVMIDSSLDSPLCSVLTAKGMLNNVIDLDWFTDANKQRRKYVNYFTL